MKILYGVLTGKSGGDVYFNLLKSSQEKFNSEIYFKSYNRYWSLYPRLLRRFVKTDSRFDIIHSNAEYGFAFKQSNRPLVISALHIIEEPMKTSYLTLSQKYYYQLMLTYIGRSIKSTKFVVAISKATEQSVKKLYGITNINTIYCGIDTSIFKPLHIDKVPYPDKIKLLFVGNLTKRKGVDLLPKIMERLDNRYVLLYTTGLRTVKKVFSDERMIPLGRLSISDMVYWYNASDICLLPTRLEGFGYAVAEAMACGKPVVTSNCSSLPEIVIDGENGFLCQVGDVADFVDKIQTLANNSAMCKNIGSNNRNRIINYFSIEKMGKEYNKLYQNVIKEYN